MILSSYTKGWDSTLHQATATAHHILSNKFFVNTQSFINIHSDSENHVLRPWLFRKVIPSQKMSVSTQVGFLRLTGKTRLQHLYIELPNLSQPVASETQLLV
jgi:hypothetical protein